MRSSLFAIAGLVCCLPFGTLQGRDQCLDVCRDGGRLPVHNKSIWAIFCSRGSPPTSKSRLIAHSISSPRAQSTYTRSHRTPRPTDSQRRPSRARPPPFPPRSRPFSPHCAVAPRRQQAFVDGERADGRQHVAAIAAVVNHGVFDLHLLLRQQGKVTIELP